ncbi:unnamed protein product [Pedinophyceae sp. YPF-701]|nr:unnamed protein product [Pedinophyceae sp. YPF-701]
MSARISARISAPQRIAAQPRALRARPVAPRRLCVTAAKTITTTEIPNFIHRDDLMDQLRTWATIECMNRGAQNFGLPMTIEEQFDRQDDEDVLWGMTISILREGERACDISFGFDSEYTEKSQYLDMDPETGMPIKGGKITKIKGKNFVIEKTCDRPVDDELRGVIRSLCGGVADALGRFYSFGSVWSEDI